MTVLAKETVVELGMPVALRLSCAWATAVALPSSVSEEHVSFEALGLV